MRAMWTGFQNFFPSVNSTSSKTFNAFWEVPHLLKTCYLFLSCFPEDELCLSLIPNNTRLSRNEPCPSLPWREKTYWHQYDDCDDPLRSALLWQCYSSIHRRNAHVLCTTNPNTNMSLSAVSNLRTTQYMPLCCSPASFFSSLFRLNVCSVSHLFHPIFIRLHERTGNGEERKSWMICLGWSSVCMGSALRDELTSRFDSNFVFLVIVRQFDQ